MKKDPRGHSASAIPFAFSLPHPPLGQSLSLYILLCTFAFCFLISQSLLPFPLSCLLSSVFCLPRPLLYKISLDTQLHVMYNTHQTKGAWMMILHFQPFPISMSIGVNPCLKPAHPDLSSIHFPWLQTHPCLSCLLCPLFWPCTPPCFLPVEFFSAFSVASLARGAVAATKLRKTNPISKSPEPAQPLSATRLTGESRRPRPQKTNPIKPSFPPRYASRLTRYEKQTQSNPILPLPKLPLLPKFRISARRSTTSRIRAKQPRRTHKTTLTSPGTPIHLTLAHGFSPPCWLDATLYRHFHPKNAGSPHLHPSFLSRTAA